MNQIGKRLAVGAAGLAGRALGLFRRPVADAAAARRVVIVRLDEIGDMVLCSPLLMELRRRLPAAKIVLVVRAAVRNLVERCPYVDHVIAYHPASGGVAWLREWRRVRRDVRAALGGAPDLGIAPRLDTDPHHAVLGLMVVGAARRVGFTERATEVKRRRDAGMDYLLTDVLPADGALHEVRRNWEVLRIFGEAAGDDRLEVWVSTDDRAKTEQVAGVLTGVRGRIILCPGGGAAQRRWPVERFAEVARDLAGRGYGILVVGGPGEAALGEAICRAAGHRGVSTVGQLTLRETAALMGRGDMYVGNDTGPMHLAAASGLPVVEISGHPHGAPAMHRSAPERFGPWGVPARILRPAAAVAPCANGCVAGAAHCILEITVEEVLKAALELLAEGRGNTSSPQPAGPDPQIRTGP